MNNLGNHYVASLVTLATPIIGASFAALNPKLNFAERVKILKFTGYCMSKMPVSDLYRCNLGNLETQRKYAKTVESILA